MKLVVMLALAGGLACQAGSGMIEGRSLAPGKNRGPAPQGGYEPGGADADTPDAGAIEDGGAVIGEIGIEQLAWRAARATCRRRLECCPSSAPPGADDLDTCAQDVADLLVPFLEELGRAVTAGRASYDGLAAASCVTDLETAACPEARTWEVLQLAARCPITGAAVPAGAECQASYECIEGFCQGAEPALAGRCVTPKLPDGQPCRGADDCASGFCHPTLNVCAPGETGELCDG